MNKKTTFFSRGTTVLCTLVALAGVSAGRANAASVFLWVADGTNVIGYSQGTNGTLNSATPVTGASLTCTGGDCFSVATSGNNGTSENLFVADSGLHTLNEYTWNGTALTHVGTTFNFTADSSAGAISPQEIAIDGSGNLWTTSFDGQIVMYNGTSGAATVEQCPTGTGCALAGARGIMIDGTTAYVTVEGGYGTGGSVKDFSTSTVGSAINTYATISSTLVGGQATGQMRGITYDAGGNIYFADSTWAQSGTNTGYICETNCTTPIVSGLGGPNELETGLGTQDHDGSTYDCNVLYEVNYYAGTIVEVGTGYSTAGSTHGHCAESGGLFGDFASGLTHPSGIALSPAEAGLGGASVANGPTFISDPVTASPEPGTLAFMIGALFLAFGIGIRLHRRRAQENQS